MPRNGKYTHYNHKNLDIYSPSQGSGAVFAARSSMENLISRPFSIRDSGSAFMSQYWRPDAGSTFSFLMSLETACLVGFVCFFACCFLVGFWGFWGLLLDLFNFLELPV